MLFRSLLVWVELFNPDKEDLSWAPVWIRLYLLPVEYWEENSLQAIENTLGKFAKVAKEMKTCRYTSFARICIYMNLNQALPDAVSISHYDIEWVQSTDYEHVPFRCQRCHALGHLFRDYMLTQKTSPTSGPEASEEDGFIKVTNCRKSHKKQASKAKVQQSGPSMPSTSNSFGALTN